MENNYLSSTEKRRQTYLNNKQNLTPEEQKDKERLNRKDLESDMAVYAACSGTGADCQAEREKAKVAQDTYFNQTYQNPKEAQAGYQQIMNLLNSTDPNAKEVFNVLEGYTQAFMTFGYTEEEARARAGAYVGSMYIAGGVSAVVASGALTKQFGKDVAPGAKPSTPPVKPSIDVNKGLPVPDGLSKEIHPGQQGKHIPGHNNYTPGRSPLVDGVDPQGLLNGVHTGEYQIIRMTPRNQPVVNFGKPIGTYEGQPTSYGIIHSGKNGAHVVPANPVQH